MQIRLRTRFIIFVVAALATLAPVGCESGPDPIAKLETTDIVDIARPGTALIISNYEAHIQVPDVTIPDDKVGILQQRVIQQVNSGQVAQSEDAIVDALVKELFTNWQQYLAGTGTSTQVDASMTAVGSGFFITPDGYIVTNAHVVATEGAEIKQGLASNAMGKLIERDIQSFQQELGSRITSDNLALLRKVCVDFYAANMSLGKVERNVNLLVATQAGGMDASRGIAAEVVEIGAPIPGKDVAILKVSGEDFPTLAVGDDKALRQGERIMPLGFPADATFFPAFQEDKIAKTPSLTQGIVSGKKTMKDGWEVIQTDAVIRGGNSGGPVLNSDGEVIGLATFGLVDQSTGTSAEGANFVVPMTVVKEFLQRANVTPKESRITAMYNKALADMRRHHYKPAIEQLKQVDALKPGQAWVQDSLQLANKAVAEGKDKTPNAMRPMVAAGAGTALLLVIVVIAAALKKPKSKGVVPPPRMG